jgi:hypothetical protein
MEVSLLEAVFRVKPHLMLEHFEHFMFKVLPSFIIISQEEITTIIENPYDFLVVEEYRIEKSSKLRIHVAQTWLRIIDVYGFREEFLQLKLEEACFQFITAQFSSPETWWLGGYLFLKFSQHAQKHSSAPKERIEYFQDQLGQVTNWLIPKFLEA